LQEFDFSFQPGIDERLIRELAGLTFIGRQENVLFLGPPGVGNYRKKSVMERNQRTSL
jgi:DNA replication protein DnaC